MQPTPANDEVRLTYAGRFRSARLISVEQYQ
jgi:hypothetical protein